MKARSQPLPRVLVIETGGTICQRPGKDGVLRPSEVSVTSQLRTIQRVARVEVDKLAKPLDSTNMLHEQRAMIARKIAENADDFAGFVVVHGTDTMSDTAAALTYMIQGLGKPVMLTGSQLPIFDERTDGKSNLHAAITAATMDFGEVGIVFGNGIYRGPRAIKDDEEGFNAFLSPRTPPIGKVGIKVEPLDGRIRRFEREVVLFTEFDTRVGFFFPMSGVSTNLFNSAVNDPGVGGFVFVGFGAGNVPEVYYEGLRLAQQQNKPIVVVTQCIKGAADMGIYETGSIPLQLGVIPGGDMTMQAVTQKLMYALGKAAAQKIPVDKLVKFVKRIIHTDYAQDISSLNRVQQP